MAQIRLLPPTVELTLIRAAREENHHRPLDLMEPFQAAKLQPRLARRNPEPSNIWQIAIEKASGLAPLVCTVLGAWLQARYGRKVRLKDGDVEVEARTPEELEQVLQLIAKYRRVELEICPPQKRK